MSKQVKPLTLPYEEGPLNSNIEVNTVYLMDHIVDSIDYAINKNLSTIDVFNIDKSDYVVQLDNSSFQENLDHIYEYFIKNELYEHCEKVCKLRNKLRKRSAIGI